MKRMLTSILLIALLAAACKNDDAQPVTQSQPVTQKNLLIGDWQGVNKITAAGQDKSYNVDVTITSTSITITNATTQDATSYNYTLGTVDNKNVMIVSSDLSLTVLELTATSVTIIDLQNKPATFNMALTKVSS